MLSQDGADEETVGRGAVRGVARSYGIPQCGRPRLSTSPDETGRLRDRGDGRAGEHVEDEVVLLVVHER